MPSETVPNTAGDHNPAAAPSPLADLRVLDLTHHIAGPYCTKWLATLGANVTKIERPEGGDIARNLAPFPQNNPHPEKSGLFLYMNTGKRSVALDLATPAGRDTLLDLVRRSDVVVENFRPGVMATLGLGYEQLAEVNPAIVLTSVSNFGQTGPYRDLRASEVVLFGMGGLMSIIGFEDSPPLKFGGYQSLYMGGLSALTATLTALLHAETTGAGQHVDVSLFEGMVSSSFQSMVQYEYTGRIQKRTRAMYVFPCRDGYVGMFVQDHQWRRLVGAVQIPGLESETFTLHHGRRANYGELEAIMLPWTLERSKQEIYALGQAAGLPFSFFASIDDVFESPQYEAREFFSTIEHPVAGSYAYPGSPVRFDGIQPPDGRAPLLGEHTDEVLREDLGSSSDPPATVNQRSPAANITAAAKPLDGVRVLDMGHFWAGPYAGRLLGDAGADVIKIESERRSDPLRLNARGLYPDRDPGDRPWNRSGMVNERNRSKSSLVIDLQTDAGRDILLRLVAVHDIMIENFSRGVLERLGLGFEALHEVNPRLVLVSITSQGLTGPEADYVSYGTTLEQNAGLYAITGFPDRTPGFSGISFPDPLGGMLGAASALAALREARDSGVGRHVEVSQREMTTHVVGEAMLEREMTGTAPGPIGNRHPSFAPQGAYQCTGEDRWITLTIESGDQWAALAKLIGHPELANGPGHSTVEARRQHHDSIDTFIREWTSSREMWAAVEALQDAGIAAGPVLNAEDLYHDRHLAERDYFEIHDDPDAGEHRYISRPYKLLGTPVTSDRPTPLFGQHNAETLQRLLNLSPDEIATLEADGVIGDQPRQFGR